MDYVGDEGTFFSAPETLPYNYQTIATFGDFNIVINGICSAAGAEPTVSIADSTIGGRAIPEGFVLRYLTCSTAVYDMPSGQPVGENAVYYGQSFYVNPKPVSAGSKSWTEIFVSGDQNGYIPTSCVQ